MNTSGQVAAPVPKQFMCDRCHVAAAKFRVIVGERSLYFCAHHFHKHHLHCFLMMYEVRVVDQ